MTIGKRIVEARRKKGLKQIELARLLNIKQQTIHSIESGQVKQPRQIKRIAELLNVSIEWLLFGSETKFISINDQIPLILFKDIPIFLHGNTDKICIEMMYIPLPRRDTSNMFAFQINDDSMKAPIPNEDSFNVGEYVVIDIKKEIRSGNFVIAEKDNKPTFRRFVEDFTGNLLVAINPTYPTIKIDSDTKIIGVCIAKTNIKLY